MSQICPLHQILGSVILQTLYMNALFQAPNIAPGTPQVLSMQNLVIFSYFHYFHLVIFVYVNKKYKVVLKQLYKFLLVSLKIKQKIEHSMPPQVTFIDFLFILFSLTLLVNIGQQHFFSNVFLFMVCFLTEIFNLRFLK